MLEGMREKGWRPLLACGCILLAAHAARGATGVEFVAVAWNAGITGHAYDTSVRINGTSASVDFRNDLALGRNLNPGFRLVWRQGNPFVPDLEADYTHINSNGDTVLHADITWGGVTYVANGHVYSQVMLKTGHLIAFWNPVDNRFLNVRAGIEARWLNLNIPVSGKAEQTTPVQRYFEAHTAGGNVAWLPMGHLGLIVHVIHGLDVLCGGSYTWYAKSYFFDLRAGVAYHFDSGLLLSAGWRRLRLHFDDDRFTINGDMVFKGAYAGIGYRF